METSEIDPINPPDLFIFSGEWDLYQESLYEIFLDTICKANLTFQGLPIRIKKHPEYKEKHFTFWHLTSEGEKEEERTPDLRRCERLSWVSWIIINCDKNNDISYWENKRGSQKHIVIWHEKGSYAVILAKRNGYFLLKTAYHVKENRAKDFIKDRSKSLNKKV